MNEAFNEWPLNSNYIDTCDYKALLQCVSQNTNRKYRTEILRVVGVPVWDNKAMINTVLTLKCLNYAAY